MIPPDLSVIIISWNVADLLAQCLDSLWQSEIRIVHETHILTHINTELPLVEVIVVDSASQDNSVSMLREKFPWIQLEASAENIGFVRGNNLGLSLARGKMLMLLNPDTEVQPPALSRLMEVLQSDANIGIVGPHTLNSDGTHQSTRRRFPTFWTAIFESTWFEKVAPQGVLARFRVAELPDDGVYAVDWVQGSALMAKRAVYEQIGGLDERYIMYSEEMDWCRQATLAGWQVYYVGDAKITHHSGQSTVQVKARSIVHFQHSKLRYFRKFHGVGIAFVLRLVLILSYLIEISIEGGKWLLGHKRALRAERVRVYAVVVKSLLFGENLVRN